MTNFFTNKTILVPFDFSDGAREAVDEALSMSDGSSPIFVLHVLPPAYALSVEFRDFEDLEHDAERIEGAMSRMKAEIGDPSYAVDFKVRIGDPGSEIVDCAKEIAASLIVMPSHGRTGFRRLLIGSVAERVVRLAECPVMVLRKPRPE